MRRIPQAYLWTQIILWGRWSGDGRQDWLHSSVLASDGPFVQIDVERNAEKR
jgi:hypothetical protein